MGPTGRANFPVSQPHNLASNNYTWANNLTSGKVNLKPVILLPLSSRWPAIHLHFLPGICAVQSSSKVALHLSSALGRLLTLLQFDRCAVEPTHNAAVLPENVLSQSMNWNFARFLLLHLDNYSKNSCERRSVIWHLYVGSTGGSRILFRTHLTQT